MPASAEPNTGVQRVFAWSAVAMLVIFLLGFWVVAGYVLPSPIPHQEREARALIRSR
jgi:hypothetical protein